MPLHCKFDFVTIKLVTISDLVTIYYIKSFNLVTVFAETKSVTKLRLHFTKNYLDSKNAHMLHNMDGTHSKHILNTVRAPL